MSGEAVGTVDIVGVDDTIRPHVPRMVTDVCDRRYSPVGIVVDTVAADEVTIRPHNPRMVGVVRERRYIYKKR